MIAHFSSSYKGKPCATILREPRLEIRPKCIALWNDLQMTHDGISRVT